MLRNVAAMASETVMVSKPNVARMLRLMNCAFGACRWKAFDPAKRVMNKVAAEGDEVW